MDPVLEEQYKEKVKKLQEEYLQEYLSEDKNKYWRTDWSPFVQHDHCWDDHYILATLMYKIELNKINLDLFSDEVEEDKQKRVEQMEECVNRFKDWMEKDFMQDTMAFSAKHCASYAVFYEKDPEKNTSLSERALVKVKTTVGKWLINELSEAPEVVEYCKKNNLDPKEFVEKTPTYHTGEWDCKINQWRWRLKIRRAAIQEQKELDECFLYLSRNMRGWWY